MNAADLTYGECEGMCGGQVLFPGWDRLCDACQEEERELDAERAEALADEDDYLYTVTYIPGKYGSA